MWCVCPVVLENTDYCKQPPQCWESFFRTELVNSPSYLLSLPSILLLLAPSVGVICFLSPISYYPQWRLILTPSSLLTLLPPLTVRDRIEKLELLTERERVASDVTAESASISVATETLHNTLPQRIMKIKNCKWPCNIMTVHVWVVMSD